MTFDGSILSCYLNGTLDTTGTPTNTYTGNVKTTLGARTDGGVQFLNGSLASWDVHSRVLSAAAFANLYNSGNGVAFANYGSIAG
jgi:hypothetical protein